MKQIQMVDLRSQYLKIKQEVDKEIQKVIDSCQFINGPAVHEFRTDLQNYLGVKHVIPCANGTDGLMVSMMALGLQPGDEVITASFTFIATAEVIAVLGLIPILVDVDPDTFNLDPVAIEKAITPKTKAIVPVHIFGQCADMDSILNIAKKNNLFVIEDACQAIGADYLFDDGTSIKAGTIGDIGCTSFFPSKNLGAYGDGGAIFTNNDTYAEDLRAIVNHGMKIRYYHELIGVNSRLDSIQAAILRVKLNYLDQYAKERNRVADYYDRAFKNNPKLKIPVRSGKSTHVFHQYTLVAREFDRNELQKFLKDRNVPAMIYYPVPLHLQEAYRIARYKEGDLPVTEELAHKVISLPMSTELDNEQLEYMTASVLDFVT